jgi:hypothetical protein
MTIACRICGARFSSGIPESLKAQEQVLTAMAQHLGSHPKQATNLGATVAAAQELLATYLLIRLYIDIPPTETDLLETFRQNEESMLELFGVAPRRAD